MARVLLVTCDTADPETLGVGTELRRRGHDVRVLGHASQYPAVSGAGLGFAALAATPEGSTVDVRALDPRLAADVQLELARRTPDLVVVGATLLTGLKLALVSGVPTAVLVPGRWADAAAWAAGPVRLAARLRRVRPAKLWAEAARVLVTAAESLDDGDLPAGAIRTGPVLGPVRTRARELDPLVAVEGAQAPDGIDSAEADPDVLSRAWLYVGDGGHAGTMRALANDLPVLLAPSPLAEAVVATGAGRLVGADAKAMLEPGPHHDAAATLGARVRSAGGAAAAADELEALLPARRP